MKHLFFAVFILSIIACQKQEVDCDNYRSTCIYIQFNYSDCTPNGSELGWDFDTVTSDTSIVQVWGCPEKLNQDFQEQQERTLSDPNTPENFKQFHKQFPTSCNCE